MKKINRASTAWLPLALMATSCAVHENVLDDRQATIVSPISAWMEAVCNVRRGCCGPDPDAVYGLASCENDLNTRFGLRPGYDEGRLQIDETILSQCVAEAKTVGKCQVTDPDFTPCRGALIGTVALGETCRSSFECARGAGGVPAICLKTLLDHGDYASPSETGVCRPSPLGKAGDACQIQVRTSQESADWATSADTAAMASTTVVRCALDQGLTCAGTCIPLGQVGDACTYTDFCAPGLKCGCGLCQSDPTLASASKVPCIDGACEPMCPAPKAAPGHEYCTDFVDPKDGSCRVESLGCTYTGDCPTSWAAAQSPTSCGGGTDTFVLAECGDTFSWRREVFHLTCYYDKTSGNLVGVRNDTDTTDQFCYGSSPGHLERLAGHVPSACLSPSAGTTVTCTVGCDGGV